MKAVADTSVSLFLAFQFPLSHLISTLVKRIGKMAPITHPAIVGEHPASSNPW